MITTRIMPLQARAVQSASDSTLRAKCQTPCGTVQGFPLGDGRFIRANQVSGERHRCFIESSGDLQRIYSYVDCAFQLTVFIYFSWMQLF